MNVWFSIIVFLLIDNILWMWLLYSRYTEENTKPLLTTVLMAGPSFNAGQTLLGHFNNVNIPAELQHRFNLHVQSGIAADPRHYVDPVPVPGTPGVNHIPYLQTPALYRHASQDGSVAVNLDFAPGIQPDSDTGFSSEANFTSLPSQEMHDENQNMENGHAHRHNHMHQHNQGVLRPDWKILTNSVVFVIILFLRLMSDHIMGEYEFSNDFISAYEMNYILHPPDMK